MTWYNEHNPKAAAWLQTLVWENILTRGDIDARDIQALGRAPSEHWCHFFAGIGGWDLALQLAGWPRDRQIWTASLPCQPFSQAGTGRGEDDERHLWPVFRDLVEQHRPATLVGEQVASKAGRAWLAAVQTDLEALGYSTAATDLCAAGIGAPHIRQRLYWCALRQERKAHRAGTGGAVEVSTRTRRAGKLENATGGHAGAGGLQRGRKHRLQSTLCGDAGGLAHTETGRRGKVDPVTGGSGEGGSAQGGKRSEYGRSVGGLGHAEQLSPRRHSSAGFEAQGEAPMRAISDGARSSSTAGGPPNPQCNGLNRAQDTRQGGRPKSADSSSWDDVVYIPCADGKARPVKSGVEPLVNGLPGRVGLLRGYGNAIVPQLAAVFIQSVIDVSGEK